MRVRVWKPQNTSDQERPAFEELNDLKSLVAMTDEMMRAIGRGYVSNDVGDGAHSVHVDRRRVRDIGIALHEQADLKLTAHRLLGGGDRPLAADSNRGHMSWKQNGVT
jgi:hypothetical protein